MANATRISVITPVLNGESFIRETIESVLLHSANFNVEYIVVDDGSTDETSVILKGYGSAIKVLTQNNGGESSAVNEGIRKATGDFILVVSADDPIFTPQIFNGVEDFFDSNPSVVVWYPSWQMIDETGAIIKVIQVEEYSDERLIGRYLCLPGPGAFIRKSTAIAIHGRQEKWRFVGDYDFWLRISRLGILQKRDGVLAQWRMHEGSTSIAQRGSEMFAERIGVMDEFIDKYKIQGKLARMARGHAYYHAAVLAFFSKEVSGRRTLLKAFWARKGLIEDAEIHVVAYLLLLPLSATLKPFVIRFLRRRRVVGAK